MNFTVLTTICRHRLRHRVPARGDSNALAAVRAHRARAEVELGETLLVTAVCGLGHVLFTAVLGFLVAWLGVVLSERVGASFPRIAGGALLAFGLFYVYRPFSGHGYGHTHMFGRHHHPEHEENGGHKHELSDPEDPKRKMRSGLHINVASVTR